MGVTPDCQVIICDCPDVQICEIRIRFEIVQICKIRITSKQKKLTNVSFVCMYVGRNSEMLVFSSVFFPTVVLIDNFPRSQGEKKNKKC